MSLSPNGHLSVLRENARGSLCLNPITYFVCATTGVIFTIFAIFTQLVCFLCSESLFVLAGLIIAVVTPTVCFLPRGWYFNFKLKRRNLSFAFWNIIFSFASFVLKLQCCEAQNTLQDGGLGRCYYFLGTSGNLLHRVLPST